MVPLRLPSLLLAAWVALLPAGSAQIDPTQRAPLGEKPAHTVLHPNHHGQQAIVKFVHEAQVRLREGAWTGLDPALELPAVRAAIQASGAKSSRLFTQPEDALDQWRVTGEARSGLALHDLNAFYLLEVSDREALAPLCDALNALEIVELAYPVGTLSDPVAPAPGATLEMTSTWTRGSGIPRLPASALGLLSFGNWLPRQPLLPAPDFEPNQGYRQAAPMGVDADFGQTFSGGRGEGTVIADVETGWTDDHEDISHKALGNFIGFTGPYPWDHGTAVLGELVGQDNASGVKGIVHQADILMSSHTGSVSLIPTAIATAANAVGPGDVVVLEVQCYSSAPSPHPCEYDPAIFATVQTATANGTHVFAAAGNGANNLDSAAYGGAFDRNSRDSGAVMCGASNGSSLNIASFSNYGTRLDAHGWGYNVASTGYGDLYNGGGVTREYTAQFSGTSSATPIVTGAGIMINGIVREAYGSGLAPLQLRSLLTATGTPQGTGGQIGPRPDVRAALDSVGVPQLSLGGNLVPGGFVDVTITGTPGNPFDLGFSTTLLVTPNHLPPFGYRYLGPLQRQASGVIGAGGSTTQRYPIPNNSGWAGQTIGYLQAAVRFNSGPGTGSFTNYAPLTL